MARHWGIGPPEIYASTAQGSALPPDVDIPAAQAARYLQIALADAQTATTLHPLTLPTLMARYGALLERVGPAYLPVALENLQRAWHGFLGQGLPAAWVAVRLGDINSRLHRNQDAEKWWKAAIQLSQGRAEVGPLLEPTATPSSPWAQRLMASTLVSVSASYAQTGRLREASTFQEAALAFMRTIPTPESLNSASPPQALHAFFILQRSSLLAVHLAEVLYARKESLNTSIQYLTSAAESSERVARGLAGLPLQVDGAWNTEVPGPGPALISAYTTSKSMRDAAQRLYHDAQRTSAEAWNLLGVLYERKEGRNSKVAHMCYERAIRWSGQSEGELTMQANSATTDADWKVFWDNYQRTKSAVQK